MSSQRPQSSQRGDEGRIQGGESGTDWNPMDSAPRDGTVIHVRREHDGHEFDAVWSTGYSIHGLGGNWTPYDSMGNYGDMHLAGWKPVVPEPCPFCGGEASVTYYDDPGWCVGCDDITECRAMLDETYSSETEAVAAWNRRASPPESALENETTTETPEEQP